MAVNPVTNKTYIVNNGSATVTVIDGASNIASTIAVGVFPIAAAVNPVTNKIYVINDGGNSVTVIDGATNTTATVAAGIGPAGVAVNPVTNKIYVANSGGNSVTVIDGATNSHRHGCGGPISRCGCGESGHQQDLRSQPERSNTVTVIDGASNTTSTVAVGSNPAAVAVNPVTNKIYVANTGSSNVTVIDGATQHHLHGGGRQQPRYAMAVNPVTNKIYVANNGSSNVTVIDGATNTTTTVPVGLPARGDSGQRESPTRFT